MIGKINKISDCCDNQGNITSTGGTVTITGDGKVLGGDINIEVNNSGNITDKLIYLATPTEVGMSPTKEKVYSILTTGTVSENGSLSFDGMPRNVKSIYELQLSVVDPKRRNEQIMVYPNYTRFNRDSQEVYFETDQQFIKDLFKPRTTFEAVILYSKENDR